MEEKRSMKQLKNSKQRAVILEALRTNAYHPTADEIYKTIHPENPNISLATVYRNLNLLAEMGVIRKIPMASSSDRFDATMTQHYHVHCKTCGNVQDFFFEGLENIKPVIQTLTGYDVSHEDLVFTGLCPTCQKALAVDTTPSFPAYRCEICGHVCDGDTRFEELPDTWRCPACSAPKKMFQQV